MKSFIGRENKKRLINMKNKWRNYALKDGKIQSSYLREYSSRSPKREARETSCRNRVLESGEKQDQEEIKLVYRPPVDPLPLDNKILNDSWVIDLKELIDGNNGVNGETGRDQKTGRSQDIQPSSSSGGVMDVQDVSGKPARRKRKASNPKKHNDGSQEQV